MGDPLWETRSLVPLPLVPGPPLQGRSSGRLRHTGAAPSIGSSSGIARSLPLAVLQKYADDQGGYHAAAITYYGFFAIFPLLLVLTTVLGFILQSHPHLEQRIVESTLGQFPVRRRPLAMPP